MAFQIHPLSFSDIEEDFIVGEKAFYAHHRLTYTGSLSPSSRAIVVKDREASWPGPGKVKRFKALNEAGELVASCRWSIHEEDEYTNQTIEETVNRRLELNLPEMRIDSARYFYTLIAKGKREAIGIREPDLEPGTVVKLPKRMELVAIYVSPDYQRRGIASTLLQWGIGESERLGLPIYLEATEEGKPFYERFGFETLKEELVDARPYGVDEVQEYTFMLRPPRAQRD